MSGRKRKAESQRTRPAVAFEEPMHITMASRTAAAPQPNVLMRIWNGIASWVYPYTQPDMISESKEEEAFADSHIQSSIQRLDGTVTHKRQRTRRIDGNARPKSANDANRARQAPTTLAKGPINFGNARDDGERVRILDHYWEPPKLGFGSTKMFPEAKTSEEDSGLDSLDESLNSMRLDADASQASPSLRDSVRQYESFMPRRPYDNPLRTSQSLPRSIVRPSKSTGNLGRDDCIETIFDDDYRFEGLRISDRKKTALEVLRKEKERRLLEEKRKAAKQRRLIRQAPLKPLIQALDTKWNDRVTEIQYSRELLRILTKSFEGTELRVKDFGTLLGNRAWLNDEIINTYIEWIVIAANKAAIAEAEAAGEPVSTVPKFLAHNSFFWNNLRDKGPKSTERLMKRKKVPGTSLLEVDTVFIPINKGAHWTIGLVRPVAKTIEYLDSMGGRGADVIPVLREWVKNQLGSQYIEKEWTVPQTPVAYQSNSYDCGVFVCTNAFCVALGLSPDCYHERDLTQQRKNIAAVLLNRGFEGDFGWNSEGFLG
ncbi:hypothetical protein ONS95_002465 [Cadophora gregata]|uniref:uncharacterized protein n=1 Tax=Cadophora gregata TaxID=51156 RepID=UPI0026DB0E65|nr:uncharacterized protein ONS95_002465 [Cadophora gregata]KAK0109791.1 hypothetical protein ONS95_002465 [Cadophora gregata]